MIANEYKDETLKVLQWVFESKWPFIVCGSRFFGDASKSSDFDFVTDDLTLLEKLKAKGWEDSDSTKGDYLDENTEYVINKGSVQIIFVQSIERRIKARDYIVANKLDRNKTESWATAYGSQS